MLPFTHEQFLQVFADYNDFIWPSQLVAYALAVLMLLGLARGAMSLPGVGLALMWIWTGIGYHWLHFTSINTAAWAFGALFIAQGILLRLASVGSRRRASGAAHGAPAVIGWAFIAYAALLYPLLGMYAGQAYPHMPMFGVTPCPVTLFTIGMLLLTRPPVPGWLLVVPFAWSMIGGSAAFLLRVPQDAVLLLSGLAVIWIVVRNGSNRRASFARQP